jgi:hypothetical protein
MLMLYNYHLQLERSLQLLMRDDDELLVLRVDVPNQFVPFV